MYGGGGANKPLINSLNTLNTLKNSNPKELSKNLNKIQSSNLSKESNSKIQDSIKLESIKDSNSIQSKQSKTTITKIGISIVASIVLSQSLVALPSGGKFVGGSSGSIKVNGKEMNITGNNKNHIIAWGGGFNINQGEIVEFNTSHKQQASFLNLDYSNQASKILGQLKGNNHNIYLVNPSGVLIGENASINANKFVASNTIDDKTLNSFKTQTKLVETFSPVFKPNKGNIVNLGTIKANNGITLIGDTIDIRGGKIENAKGGTNKDDSIYFVGENIYIDADAVNLSSNNNIYATAFKEGYIQRQMRNFQKDGFTFGNFNQLITNESYAYNDNGNISGQSNFKKVITLGNGNADEALSEWYWFANGWNNKKGDTQNIDEFRLVGDIDFSKQIGGRDRIIIDFSDSTQNKIYTGNYAAPTKWDSSNPSDATKTDYGDAMMVGYQIESINSTYNANSFRKEFDGGGYSLSNIDIEQYFKTDSDGGSWGWGNKTAGIFGAVNGNIYNFVVNNIDVKTKNSYRVGAIVGVLGGSASNIVVNNIKNVINEGQRQTSTGGFAGVGSNISNVVINGIGNIENIVEVDGYLQSEVGGFVGRGSDISNVVINNIGTIRDSINDANGERNYSFVGGFVGRGSNITDIVVNGIQVLENNYIGFDKKGDKHYRLGGFLGEASGVISNIKLNNIGTIKSDLNFISNNTDYSLIGGFIGHANNTTINNITIIGIDNIEAKNALKSMGGFIGQIAGELTPLNVSISEVKIEGIKNIEGNNNGYVGGFLGSANNASDSLLISNIYMSDFERVSGNNYVGGFVGNITTGTITNIIMNDFDNIILDNAVKTGMHYVGGFVGNANGTNILLDNIALNNFGIISGKHEQQVGVPPIYIYSGGFAGRITSIKANHIAINGIEKISAERKEADNTDLYIGGFSGYISNSSISNVILNGIKNLNATYITSNSQGNQARSIQMGGFTGYIGNKTSFENIYLYFDANMAMTNDIQWSKGGQIDKEVGKFYGSLSGSVTLNNINLYYNANPSSSLANPIKDADSSNSTYYNQTINPTDKDIASNKINLYTYDDSSKGKESFKQALESQNNLGGAFESNNIKYTQDSSGNYYYYFTNTTGANVTPPSIIPPSIDTDPSLPNIDLGNVVLEGSDFSVSILQEIINDILNGKYGINIDNREVLSNLAESLNNANTLQDYFNAINSYLISSSLDESTKESIRQSMDFLVAFYGENGLGNKFKGDTNYKDFYDKSFYISTSLKDLGNFISGDLNGRLDSMIKNIQILESLKQRIKAAQKYYQEALEAKLPYETLEGIYNEMVKIIDESYAKAQSLLNTLESEDEVYLTNLLGEYSIKENSGFDDIRGIFSFSGNDILSKIDSIILEDKPALTPPTKEEVGDDPTKENNPDVPNNLQKIADLASKEAILILPAQEKQEAIVEDGKERGRLCIVSDNAKTNNPCMAITY